MSPALQAKLLKILEDRSLRRLGGTVPIECDTRIIAATNQDLTDKVRKGFFRKDLYFRLHVLSLNIPSLRERGNDAILLANHFIRRFSLEFKRPVEPISEDLKKVLLDYGWPGNVRELRNVLERFFILENETVIKPEHLNLGALGGPASDGSGPRVEAGKLRMEIDLADLDLRELVKMVIQQVLKATGLNQVKAARLLRISRDNLRYRMKKYGIPGKTRNTGSGDAGSDDAGSGSNTGS
jgi:transcriptional regulator with PAS, ATPase and Fis domain